MNAKSLFGWSLVLALGVMGCGSSQDRRGSNEPIPEGDRPNPETEWALSMRTPEPAATPEPTVEPTPTAEPTPTPPMFADGVYVSRFGLDSNPGTGAQHMKTIKAAIERAKALGKKDVWLAADSDGWDWFEIVHVPDGINLHGGVCVATYPMTPPATVDPAACRTSISGASPALIAEGVTMPTLVENLEVRGRGIEADDEYAFKLPGGA